MAFNHIVYLTRFLADHKSGIFTNDSVAIVDRSAITPRFVCIGIHHLTPNENVGKRNIYLNVINASTGERMNNERIAWGWQGMNAWEHPNPVILDKPSYEPGGNISVDWGQKIWVRVLDRDSDMVSGLTTQLPDQGDGNRLGHHSYYIVFAYVDAPTDPPPVDPPAEDCAELRQENAELKEIMKSIKDILNKV